MKKYFLFCFTLLFVCRITSAQSGNTDVASLLFKGVKTKLTDAEKKYIASSLGFVPSGNKENPFAVDKDSKEFPFNTTVVPTDMNKDGNEEIFVLFGNSYTSGAAGSSISLFIKNASGTYETNLGFPGMLPDELTTSNKGYPDLMIGGPGFEYPVWRWNGKAYDFHKKIKEADYLRLKKSN